MIRCLVAAIAAMISLAASAHADGDSFIRYINDHGIYDPGINDSIRLSRGVQACTQLHNGMTAQQVVESQPIVYFDLRGVVEAAQHELCPDTLGH
jgi:Protein of unknown function (DUF732)